MERCPVTLKWRDIGRAALDALFDNFPTGVFASHGRHFIHEDPENVGYVALRESDDGITELGRADINPIDPASYLEAE